ncbi:hypothetical protein [Desulfobacula toluolica]|uniref:Uncharacterized protein n=1 Tax=Desulfobacula toluolica (strain DSM 7467 / Tol2) TaxID=651182 RepID=K0NPM2_DESTT|nr:hypothetical protein [Desulfobacula toluolica]CCK80817.1 uncharacterized protein TOL2_C26580 [Desulfobacula toluolica Tol2]
MKIITDREALCQFLKTGSSSIRINEDFLFVKDDPYDMFMLLDAASAYILGFVFSKVVEEAPNEKNVENLF